MDKWLLHTTQHPITTCGALTRGLTLPFLIPVSARAADLGSMARRMLAEAAPRGCRGALAALALLVVAAAGLQEASRAVTMLQAEEGEGKVMSPAEAAKFMTATKLDLVARGRVKITKLYKRVGELLHPLFSLLATEAYPFCGHSFLCRFAHQPGGTWTSQTVWYSRWTLA